MRERPAKLPASLHHSSSSCHVNVTNVTNAINTTSSSLARVRKEEAKRASLLGISSLEENDTGSLLEEIEGSLLEEREASLLRCRAASRLFRSLHWFVKTLQLCVITITTIGITIITIITITTTIITTWSAFLFEASTCAGADLQLSTRPTACDSDGNDYGDADVGEVHDHDVNDDDDDDDDFDDST